MKEKDRAVVLRMADRFSKMAKEVPSVPESWSEDMSTSLKDMSTSLKKLCTLLKNLGSSLNVLAASLTAEGAENSSGETLNEALHLDGLITICMYCKKIRDDKGQWETKENYLEFHTSAKFSHGICPDCFAKYVGDLE